jgi:GT2 family glycosyltransferase
VTEESSTAVPRLSIIIVSWNSRDDLQRCLSSLGAHTTGVALELIVVDNASSDGTVQAVRDSHPDVRLIENSENLGFARACNQGMAVSSGKYLLLLNADTWVEDDVIGRAVRLLSRRSEIGMLGCQLRFPDGRIQHTVNRALSIRHSLLERLWLYKLIEPSRRAELLLGGYWEHDSEVEVDWLAGAFLLLRRELFVVSGGFDERFFMYGEDSEWCMRLRRLGYRIMFSPEPGAVVHSGSVSSDLVWTEKERLRLCHVGGLESYAALHGSMLGLGYRFAELIGATARLGAYVIARRLRDSEYFERQATFYRWLVEFYVAPHRRVSSAHHYRPSDG